MEHLHIDIYVYNISESHKSDVPFNIKWQGFHRKAVCECTAYGM